MARKQTISDLIPDKPKAKKRGKPFVKGDPRVLAGHAKAGRKPFRKFQQCVEAALNKVVQHQRTRKQVIDIITEKLMDMAKAGDIKAMQEVFKIVGAYAPIETDNTFSSGPVVLQFTEASPNADTDSTA